MAVKAAALLDSIGLTGFGALIAVVAVLNLFVLSGSALWSLIGPVFVPAFMLLGMSPALTQAAFRIGDSATAVITPMNPGPSGMSKPWKSAGSGPGGGRRTGAGPQRHSGPLARIRRPEGSGMPHRRASDSGAGAPLAGRPYAPLIRARSRCAVTTQFGASTSSEIFRSAAVEANR